MSRHTLLLGLDEEDNDRPDSNVTLFDFLSSISETATSPYIQAYSQAMNRHLTQFTTIPALLPFRPTIVATAQYLADISNPASDAQLYYGFQVLQSVVVTYSLHGHAATALTALVADMLHNLMSGPLGAVKYCRFRHLAERHVLVAGTVLTPAGGTGTAAAPPPVGYEFRHLTMMRQGARRGVTELEARYLEELADDFLEWMDSMGMVLQ
jgi:hypothetical protein